MDSGTVTLLSIFSPSLCLSRMAVYFSPLIEQTLSVSSLFYPLSPLFPSLALIRMADEDNSAIQSWMLLRD